MLFQKENKKEPLKKYRVTLYFGSNEKHVDVEEANKRNALIAAASPAFFIFDDVFYPRHRLDKATVVEKP